MRLFSQVARQEGVQLAPVIAGAPQARWKPRIGTVPVQRLRVRERAASPLAVIITITAAPQSTHRLEDQPGVTLR